MKKLLTFATIALATASAAHAQYAKQVLSYTPGTTPAAGYTDAAAALGTPQRDTDFGAVTPFNPPYSPSDLVSIGEGGQLTLRLSNYAVAQPGGPEIGVFTNLAIADVDWPNNQAGTGAGFSTFGSNSAVVEVSADGVDWVSLGLQEFNVPAAGFTDEAATLPSDFTKPFTGGLGDFEGIALGGALTLLDGSGGGLWLDITPTGLDQVGFLRFDVPLGSNPLDTNFELDAVSIAQGAIGAFTAPEPAAALLLLAALPLTTRRHVPSRRA